MDILSEIRACIGDANVLTGKDCAPWTRDWMGSYESAPLAVIKPVSTAEVSQVLRLANDADIAVVPVGGNTGLVGGSQAIGSLVLSLDRMNKVEAVRPADRSITVQAGAILDVVRQAADDHDLAFPLTFGARGSATIGGVLSTNAGGSNVLRYGNTRDLCLGLEAVLADGRVLDLMSALHKDNSGYDLRDLIIGSEGTLAVVTRAIMKLTAKPRAYATAMVAMETLDQALDLLNRLNAETGGGVEAFEFMPREYIDRHLAVIDGAKPPFDSGYDVNILVEIASTAEASSTQGPDGRMPLVAMLEDTLAAMIEEEHILDAVIAQNLAQRQDFWARREAAAEISHGLVPFVDTDVAVPLHNVDDFLRMAKARVAAIAPDCETLWVAHLGDGNIHFSLYPQSDDKALHGRLLEAVEDVVEELGGSFSAEHGIGLSKLETMSRRKNPVVLDVMRDIKSVLDPKNTLNPGKTIPGRA